MPLFAHGRVVGVLQLLNPVGKEQFSQEDLERMRLFAGPLGQAIDNARLYSALKSQYLSTVTALAEAVEKRDPYTGGHVRRVVQYSILLGFELGLPARGAGPAAARLGAARRGQDRGARPGAAQAGAARPGRGRADEAAHHRRGGDRRPHPELHDILPGVRSHHERLDGMGYPDGLFDADIPLPARIIAVADTYDAMTTSRPYRSALERVAGVVGDRRRGRQPVLSGGGVGAFERLVRRGEFTIERGARLMASLFGTEERL